MADQVLEVRDWPGLATNADAHDITPGASVEQVNCAAIRQGELEVRQGYVPVTFEN